MSYPKICVYAICKNESQFVERWYESVKESDYICVLDTGSTDDTIEKFKTLGIILESKVISPWRFDVARNESLKLVPEDTDILVCLDLDEVISEGWVHEVKEKYTEGINRFIYKYVWNFNEDGSEGITFNSEKIHSKGYKWVYPVHEVLRKDDGSPELRAQLNICVSHHADDTKSRTSYLPLLKMAREENPEDDRTAHYLGREYFFHREFEKAIQTLKEHLELKSSCWPAERCASMRYIAKCYTQLGDPLSSEIWFGRAIIEAPNYREPYTDMAEFMYGQDNWYYVIKYALLAKKITERTLDYLCEPKSWGSFLDDLLSVSYWNMGNKEEAIAFCKKALSLDAKNERIKKNLAFMEGN